MAQCTATGGLLVTLSEVQVENFFADHLRREGWAVETKNADFIDIRATRGDEVLVAEVKGHTKSAGAALDIGYGQLLRRMDLELQHRYALVVPSSLEWHAQRVRPAVRALFRIELFLVDTDGAVQKA